MNSSKWYNLKIEPSEGLRGDDYIQRLGNSGRNLEVAPPDAKQFIIEATDRLEYKPIYIEPPPKVVITEKIVYKDGNKFNWWDFAIDVTGLPSGLCVVFTVFTFGYFPIFGCNPWIVSGLLLAIHIVMQKLWGEFREIPPPE